MAGVEDLCRFCLWNNTQDCPYCGIRTRRNIMAITCPHCEREIDVPEIIELTSEELEHLTCSLELTPDCEICQAIREKLH